MRDNSKVWCCVIMDLRHQSHNNIVAFYCRGSSVGGEELCSTFLWFIRCNLHPPRSHCLFYYDILKQSEDAILNLEQYWVTPNDFLPLNSISNLLMYFIAHQIHTFKSSFSFSLFFCITFQSSKKRKSWKNFLKLFIGKFSRKTFSQNSLNDSLKTLDCNIVERFSLESIKLVGRLGGHSS